MARVVSSSTLPGGLTPKSGGVDSAVFTMPVTTTCASDYGPGLPVQVGPALSEDIVVFGLMESSNSNTTGQTMHTVWAGEPVSFYGVGSPLIDASGTVLFPTLGSGGTQPSAIWRLTASRQLSIFVGNVTAASTDGTGTAASLNNPNGIALAADGNYYVTEQGAGRVRKITPAGVTTTLAGNGNNASVDGPGNTASFGSLRSIVFNAYDNCLYVYDGANYKIRRITMAGVVSTVAGTGLSAYTNGNVGTSAIVAGGAQLASDGVGGIYFADYQTVRKMDTTTANYTVTTFAGAANTAGQVDGSATNARFYGPYGVAWDTIQNCLFVHQGGLPPNNAAIRKVTSAGVVSTLTPTSPNNTTGQHDGMPTSSYVMTAAQSQLGYDPSGWIWLSDGGSFRLRRFNAYDGRVVNVVGHSSGTGINGTITGTVPAATRIATVGSANISSVGKQGWLPLPYPVRVPAGNKLWISSSNLTAATGATMSVSLAWAPISLFQ